MSRFEVISKERTDNKTFTILKDKETGVLYLNIIDASGVSAGITVLVDSTGKPSTK